MLHSFFTKTAHFAVARFAELAQSGCQLIVSGSETRLHGFGVAGDSLEGESPGEIRFMSSELEPGRCGLLRHPSFGQDEKRRTRGLMRKLQDASFDRSSPERWFNDSLSLGETTVSERTRRRYGPGGWPGPYLYPQIAATRLARLCPSPGT